MRRLTALLVLPMFLLLSACGDDGPSEDAMERAWLAWAGRDKVWQFEKINCMTVAEERWYCRFRTKHLLRKGRRRVRAIATRSGYYDRADDGWTYVGKAIKQLD